MENQKLWEAVENAIAQINTGMCKRVDVNDCVKVYEVKGTIRIDIKRG